RHPDTFSVAASWDFPADMFSCGQFTGACGVYGNDANFQGNYQLTQSFVDAHKTPFLAKNRLWIGGGPIFSQDASDYDALLTSEGIAHATAPPSSVAHRWDGGWVPGALAVLSQDSSNLP